MSTNPAPPLVIEPLRQEDRAAWGVLAVAYNAFYERVLPDAQYDATWQRLLAGDGLYGFAARRDGRLCGITHYLFHATVWSTDACYLQDLFVDEAARGGGAARALIEAVAQAARGRGASRLYWSTRENNSRARRLYDQVACFNGFIRYDYPLEGA